MNLQHERISELCQHLKLERTGAEWSHLAHQAAAAEDSFGDFLERLLTLEREARAERTRTTLLKLASLPAVKTLEQYDFSFASGAPRAQLQELAALTFIERAENIVLLGRKRRRQDASGDRAGLPGADERNQDPLYQRGGSDAAAHRRPSPGSAQGLL